MTNYQIGIKEVREGTYTVEAETEQEALEKVENMYNNLEVELGPECCIESEFEVEDEWEDEEDED